jgi:hypothetical protein
MACLTVGFSVHSSITKDEKVYGGKNGMKISKLVAAELECGNPQEY